MIQNCSSEQREESDSEAEEREMTRLSRWLGSGDEVDWSRLVCYLCFLLSAFPSSGAKLNCPLSALTR